MNKTEQEVFYSLLKSALWQQEPDLSTLQQPGWQWDTVLQVLERHAVLGLVIDTILSLPESLQPAAQQTARLMQFAAANAKTHRKLCRAILEVTQQMDAAGIPTVLLKGEGLVPYYPQRCIRSCGDIDLYIGPEHYETAKSVFLAQCTPEEAATAEESEVEHHLGVQHWDLIYELHRYAGMAGDPKYQTVYLQRSGQYLQPGQCPQTQLSDGSEVCTPPMQFNAWYIFNHIIQHFREGGIGIRQFCDWARVLYAATAPDAPTPLDQDKLRQDLQTVGLYRPWRVLGGILVRQLGYPQERFPFYSPCLARQSQGLVLRMLTSGQNFHFGGLDESYRTEQHGLHRLTSALRYFTTSTLPLFPISPGMAYRAFLRYIRFGVNGLRARH